MRVVTFYVRREFDCSIQKLKKLVGAICSRFGLANVTVSIAIVDNKQIRILNKKFLHRKTVTDCLAFDLSEPDSDHRLFELVINGQKAKSEAAKRHHSALAELALYVTHGLLHILGFNDLLLAQAKKMHQLEDEILQQQGFGPVYGKKRKIVLNKQRQKC
jgi:probable rRNA maturation factor